MGRTGEASKIAEERPFRPVARHGGKGEPGIVCVSCSVRVYPMPEKQYVVINWWMICKSGSGNSTKTLRIKRSIQIETSTFVCGPVILRKLRRNVKTLTEPWLTTGDDRVSKKDNGKPFPRQATIAHPLRAPLGKRRGIKISFRRPKPLTADTGEISFNKFSEGSELELEIIATSSITNIIRTCFDRVRTILRWRSFFGGSSALLPPQRNNHGLRSGEASSGLTGVNSAGKAPLSPVPHTSIAKSKAPAGPFL